MKILFLTPFFPYPIHKNGATVRTYNILKELKKKGIKVDLLSLDDNFIKPEEKLEMEKLVENIILLEKPKINFIKNILRKFSLKPYDVLEIQNSKIESIVKERLKLEYDIVYCDQFAFSEIVYKYNFKRIKSVLSPNDLISLFYKKEATKENKKIKKLKLQYKSFKYKKYERYIFEKFSRIIMVANEDKEVFERETKLLNSNLVVIPNGVDTDYFDKNKIRAAEEKAIVFTGIMNYAPNIRAVLDFIKVSGERLLERDIKFYIVGKNPTKEILDLEKKYNNIEVTGFVEDIREYIAKGSIYICPLKTGTGIKNKLLEAMSMSKFIITTKTTANGINLAKGNKEFIISDDFNEYIKIINDYIDNPNKRKKISEKARECVLKNYSWKLIADRIIEELK